MKMMISNKLIGRRNVASVILFSFLLTSGMAPVRYAYGQEAFQLPQAGTRISLSPAFELPLLKGVKVYPNNPFRLDFILDKGNSSDSTEKLKSASARLIKYFLASITVPKQDLWVNLSPYEKDRIVPEAFGVTEMGRDLLAQDYILKQITASVIYPEEKVGKEFWDKVYAEALRRYGTSEIPVDTFNKVWIVPEKAIVYENKDAAYVVESRLKVMLESDYQAAQASGVGRSESEIRSLEGTNAQELAKQVIREVVIPLLEKEVNEGKNFAQLRQVYHSLILAVWYKDKVKESIFGKAYVDQKKTGGVDIDDKTEKYKIWEQYVEAFKKGAYNYIKEDLDPVTQEVLPRRYFSGGASLVMGKAFETVDHAALPERTGNMEEIKVRFDLATNSFGNRIPFLRGTYSRLIDWQITEKCQLNCIHCYGKNFLQDAGISKFGNKELTFEEQIHIIDLLSAKGIRIIAFSGGEPLLAPRIDELCAYAKSKGMKIVINTNGLQFKQKEDKFFVEILRENGIKNLTPVEEFINSVDQINFSLDTVDPDSFRGDVPSRLPEIIRYIKGICKRRKKDIEIQITTTVMRQNIDKIHTDVLPYIQNIIINVLNENIFETGGVMIMPPIWKLNIYCPHKRFGQKNVQAGVTFEEYSNVYDSCLKNLRNAVHQYGKDYSDQFRNFTGDMADQIIRVNKHWEDASYKYLMIMPNGGLVTIVEDANEKSYGLGLRGYEVVGYLDKENPWVYEVLAEKIAHKVSVKLGQLRGRVYEESVGVIGEEERGDDIGSATEQKTDSSKLNPGGIDLKPFGINIKTIYNGEAIKFNPGFAEVLGMRADRVEGDEPDPIDSALFQQLQSASGLTPVILDISPMTVTIPQFLGLADKENSMKALARL